MPSSQKQIANKWFNRKYRISWSNFLFLPFLLLAILFWLSTKLSENVQYRKDIPVVYQTAEDIILKNDLPTVLSTRLEGVGWDLFFMDKFNSDNPFNYFIPSNKKFLNKNDIISQMNVNLDKHKVNVIDVHFPGQEIILEKKMTKKIAVIFDGDLEFKAFYKLLGNISFNPDSVEVTGPESEIEAMEEYPIDYLEIKNISKDIEQKVALKQASRKYIEISPGEVEMTIKTEQLTEKSIQIPVYVSNVEDQNINIVPDMIEIKFIIGLSEFPFVKAEDFKAQIVIPETLFAQQQYAVSIVKKPGNAIIQEINPAFVDVFFDK